MGAVLTESALDILPELSPLGIKSDLSFKQDLFSNLETENFSKTTLLEHNVTNNSIEADILDLLSTTPTPIDLIIRNISYSATETLSAITLLEINNKIIFQHNGYILAL